ncbi:MAG: replicative DNA helicase, partial [Neisseriaceae bacterium]
MRSKPKSDPPHHIEAERTLLGAILIDNATLDAVAPLITPDAFYRPAHRLIFSALVALHAKDTPIDLVTLRTELAASGNLDAAGGVPYLGGLVDGVPHVKNAHAWARLVADAHVLRQLADASDAIGEGVSDARGADEAIDRAESLISSLRRPG